MAINKLSGAAELRRNRRGANPAEAIQELEKTENKSPEVQKKEDRRNKANYMYIDVTGMKDYLRYRAKATRQPMSKYIYNLLQADMKKHYKEYMKDQAAEVLNVLKAVEQS